MKKIESVWKSVLFLGVVLSAVAIVANCFLERGLTGRGFWFGFLAVVITYVLFLIDLLFEIVQFPWGRKWKALEKSLKKPLLWRLITKGVFALSSFYTCINTTWFFSVLGRGEPEGPYYMFYTHPWFYTEQIDVYSMDRIFTHFWLGSAISILLFCLIILLEVLVAVRKRKLAQDE